MGDVKMDALAMVEKFGWTVTGVYPDVGTSDAPFAYTTGLETELMIVGFPMEIAHTTLNFLAKRGVTLSEVMTQVPTVNLELRLRADRYQGPEENWGLSNWYHDHEPYEKLQIVWSDPAGFLPGEEGFDLSWGLRQLIS